MDMEHNVRVTPRDMARKRARAWMGTVWKEVSKELLKGLDYKYLLISDDDHTQAGELHWHCLVTFENQRVFPRIPDIHWEKCMSRNGARDYCLNKGHGFFEDGDFTIADQNGEDWRGFVDFCKIHSPCELVESPFSKTYAKYRGFAGEVHNLFANLSIMDGELQNEWYWGPAGTGKTKRAWQENPGLYVKSINKWWDGYDDQEVVLLDDWDPKHEVLVSHLKLWSDRYPFRAETKGSSLMIRPKKIIITSNYSIDECFQNPQDREAIRRRFKSIYFDRLRDRDTS